MLPGINLTQFLHQIGPLIYLFVPAILFAETGLMVGFFLPGDSVLFTSGALIGVGILSNINIWVLVIIFFVAAVAGNSVGYEIGKHFGRRIYEREEKPRAKFFKKKYLRDAEKFYAAHGSLAVILAQFIPIIRTFNPIIAGVAEMKYREFISRNMIGSALWTIGVTLLGYFSFRVFGHFINPVNIDTYLLPIMFLIVLVSISPMLVRFAKSSNFRKWWNKKVLRKSDTK